MVASKSSKAETNTATLWEAEWSLLMHTETEGFDCCQRVDTVAKKLEFWVMVATQFSRRI
jgi:hypothetical protein